VIRILIGDCRERLRDLPDNSVDSCVCDPPYHLTSGNLHYDWKPSENRTRREGRRPGKGFMGQTWDGGDVAFQPDTWAEVLRVLKPGGHLVAFSGTRTYHRMAVAIEDAGFEVRDMISYHYGSGFPKSHNVNKVLHGKELVCDCGSSQVSQRDLRVVPDNHVSPPQPIHQEQADVLFDGLPQQSLSVEGWKQLPASEVRSGQPSLERRGMSQTPERELQWGALCASAGMGEANGAQGRLHHGASASHGADVRLPADANGSGEPQGSSPVEQSSGEPGTVSDEPRPQTGGAWADCGRCGKPIVPEGLGTALKPATEPICLARKPLSERSVAANVLKWGTGALNIDGCRIEAQGRPALELDAKQTNNNTYAGRMDGGSLAGGSKAVGTTDLGRWPANLVHDGSDEVVAGFPDSDGQLYATGPKYPPKQGTAVYGDYGPRAECAPRGDSGSAARFFYTAKATTAERGEGNNHPTVKPVALMRWLVKLVTPKGGTVLDPFMGSGSTGLACDAEQFDFIGCELSADYAAIAERRIREAAGMFADVSVEHAARKAA
jgi:DNA modification methylase